MRGGPGSLTRYLSGYSSQHRLESEREVSNVRCPNIQGCVLRTHFEGAIGNCNCEREDNRESPRGGTLHSGRRQAVAPFTPVLFSANGW